MTVSAQAIIMGRLSPSAQCTRIEPATFSVQMIPAESGWEKCTFGFQLYRDQIHVVVIYAHDDNLDRGHAMAKIRRTAKNLVDWFILGQTLLTDASLTFVD